MPPEETKPDPSTQAEQGEGQGGQSQGLEIGKEIDLTGLSPELKQKVESLRHDLNKAFTQKTQDLAEKSKQVEQLKTAYGEAIKEAKETRELADRHGLTVKEEKVEAQRLIDKLKANADPETERNLRQLETIISEVSDTGALRKTVDSLKAEIEGLRGFALRGSEREFQDSLASFKADAGDEIFNKYVKDVQESHKQYPTIPASQIFESLAPREDKRLYWSRIIEKDKKQDNDRKRQATTTQSSEATVSEDLYVRDKRGQIDLSQSIAKIVDKVKAKVSP